MSERKRGGKSVNVIVAVLLAMLLWLYVINVENPNATMRLRGVPVTLQGTADLEENGLMVTDISRESMTLRVTGGRRSFVRLTPNIVTISADVSRIRQAGEHVIYGSYSIRDSSLQSSLTVRETDNFAITVTVEEYTSREIPVRGEFGGTLAAGYQVDTISLSDNTVSIVGPKDVVGSIHQAVVTAGGDQISTEQNYEALPLQMIGRDGQPVQDENISCDIESVSARLSVVKVYEIPLTVTLESGGGVDAADAKVTITPATIAVSGSEERVAELTEIHLGRISLRNVFGSSERSFSISIPTGVSNRSGQTTAKVHVNLTEQPMRMLTVGKIELLNVPEGYEASLAGRSIQVWVRGAEDALEELTAADIHVSADLKAVIAEEGQQRIAVDIQLDDETELGVVGTDYSVAVVLTRN